MINKNESLNVSWQTEMNMYKTKMTKKWESA